MITLLLFWSISDASIIKSEEDPDRCDYPSSCQNCVQQIENVRNVILKILSSPYPNIKALTVNSWTVITNKP